MKHSKGYLRFFYCLNTPGIGREIEDLYNPQNLEQAYDWEREEMEDVIYHRFVRGNDFLFAEFMPKLKKYNGMEALKVKQQELLAQNKPNFHIAKTMYEMTQDNKYISLMLDIYNNSGTDYNRTSYIVELQTLAKIPEVYDKFVEIYIHDENECNRITAICAILWADGHMVAPEIRPTSKVRITQVNGEQVTENLYDENDVMVVKKEINLVKQFKREDLEERKRLMDDYRKGKYILA